MEKAPFSKYFLYFRSQKRQKTNAKDLRLLTLDLSPLTFDLRLLTLDLRQTNDRRAIYIQE